MKCASCGTYYPKHKVFCLTCGELLAGEDGKPRLGEYTLLEKLGQGGVGVVFRAKHQDIDQNVAIKILNSQSFGDKKHMQRFRREIETHSKLKHPNIIHFIDVYEEADTVALVMEMLSGCNLKEYINHKGVLPLEETLRIAIDILSALEEAHKYDFIHRDLKPSNVFLTDSKEIKLMDFGLAKQLRGNEDITDSGVTVGTYMYMAPEQILGKDIGVFTDLYALGIVLYRMTTAILPFMSTGGGEFEIMEKQVRKAPQSPQELNPEIPDELNKIILHLLAKNPENRPASCLEVIRGLNRIKASLTPSLSADDAATTFSDLNTSISKLSGEFSTLSDSEQSKQTVDFYTLLSAFRVDSQLAPEQPRFDMRHPPKLGKDVLVRLKNAISTIPALPEIWYQVQAVFEDETSSPSDLAKVITQDAVLTAHVLKNCNTAAYLPSGAKENTDVALALTRIGMDAAQSLVLSAVVPDFKASANSSLDVRGIWFHGQAIALFSRILSEYSPVVDGQSATMFGLLHDIGKLVILHLESDETLAQLKQHIDDGQDALLAEIDVLGYSHIDAGMMLALHWKLPRKLHRFIYYHHFPCWQAPETWPPDVQAAVMLVHMAHLTLSSLTKDDIYDGVWAGAHRTHVKSSAAILNNPLKLPLKDASLYSNMRVQLKHLQRLFPDLYI
ncbi:MAG TPA: serine/threonine protein kinase [Ghiorsea sp.]|nr:serine/threonine protein kinase [Ghiorsea sp.]HIP08080.1 serine/threonine protein kinase [Mariprofundaceae bacterium]